MSGGSVAVVIPAYNAAAHLATAIESAKQQTVPPARIIVVDDGSTDDTRAVAERHGAECLSQPQGGPAAARNRGVGHADTDYVAFLDADDWYEPGKLEKSVELLERLGASCGASDAWLVIGDRVERRKNDGRVVPHVLTEELLIIGNPIVCSTMVCRRQAVLDAGGFDEGAELIATEDYDLWLRLARREPIAYLAEPLAFYRHHEGSLSNNARFMRGIDLILEKVGAQHVNEPHFEQLIARRRASVRLDLAWDLFRQGRRGEARGVLAEARRLAPSWRSFKLWLRTMVPAVWRAS